MQEVKGLYPSKVQPTHIWWKHLSHTINFNTAIKEDNDPISAKSIAQTLSSYLEYTFHLSNFLIIGFCNSWANVIFTSTLILLISITPEPVFLTKKYTHTC